MQYRHIIWDWNGTIVDDLAATVEIANQLLISEGLPAKELEEHRDTFEIPIANYYRKIGLTIASERLPILDAEFHRDYDAAKHKIALFQDILPTLERLNKNGCICSVLSALPSRILDLHVDHFEIRSYFRSVSGRPSGLAGSKVDAGRKLVTESGVSPVETLVIGDTIYDHEVALAIGADCALISRGHQSERLLASARSTYLASSLDSLPFFF